MITRLLMWVSGILGFVGIIGIFLFVPIGVFFLVRASNEQDLARKKSKNRKGIIFILLPFIMTIAGLLLLLIIRLFWLQLSPNNMF